VRERDRRTDQAIDRAAMLPGKLWQNAVSAQKRRAVRDRYARYTPRVEIVTVVCGNCAVMERMSRWLNQQVEMIVTMQCR